MRQKRGMDSKEISINTLTHLESITECFPDRLLIMLIVDFSSSSIYTGCQPRRSWSLVLFLIYRHSICPSTIDLVHTIGL